MEDWWQAANNVCEGIIRHAILCMACKQNSENSRLNYTVCVLHELYSRKLIKITAVFAMVICRPKSSLGVGGYSVIGSKVTITSK